MSRYRKIDVRIWIDEKVRRLSPLVASGRAIWLYLLTNPSTSNVPGLYRAGEAQLADELGWSLEAFREAFREVLREGLAAADWEARVVWIPGVIRYDRPESPNVIKSWRVPLDEVPECDLKREALRHLKAFAEGLGEPFAKAFREAFPEGSAHPSRIPDPDPDPEPEPERTAPPEPKRRRPDAFGARFAAGPRYQRIVDLHPNPGTTHAQVEWLEAARDHYGGDQDALGDAIEAHFAWKIPIWRREGGADWRRFVTRLPKYLKGAGWMEPKPRGSTGTPRHPDDPPFIDVAAAMAGEAERKREAVKAIAAAKAAGTAPNWRKEIADREAAETKKGATSP